MGKQGVVFEKYVVIELFSENCIIKTKRTKTTENGSATIEMLHEVDGRGTEYVIPERIESVPVETIGDSAFENTGATSVVIPESVTYLEYDSFLGCTNLTDVYFYNADTEISIPVFSSGIYNQLTIYGMEDSTAEMYAHLLGIDFVYIT